VINKRIEDTYSKKDKSYYQIEFAKMPDPAYLRSRADVITDAEVLKQRMKRSSLKRKSPKLRSGIDRKADEIIDEYFHNKRKLKKPKSKKRKLRKSECRDVIKNLFHSTIDLRDESSLISNTDFNDKLDRSTNERSYSAVSSQDLFFCYFKII